MSDPTLTLLANDSAEPIPGALAAARPRRKPARQVEVRVVAEPAPALPPAAVPADTPVIEEPIVADTIDNLTQTATDQTQAMFGDIRHGTEGAMAKGQALFADLNDMTKGNVEAMVESGKLAAAGLQTLAQDRAAFVRGQFETATAAMRSMTSVKSPTEFVKLGGDYVRQQFELMVAETSRSTEAALKLAGEVAQPISNRWALAAEKMKQAA
ncbi:phasin family protein [Sphingomonas bacterium]|uniref:phasin family protein n=1 Tax=Sphingomonas bacterium TaxID=1895847 RepID=UPI0015776F28|nr:phasin family protein [Sphingomonas bacterium]